MNLDGSLAAAGSLVWRLSSRKREEYKLKKWRFEGVDETLMSDAFDSGLQQGGAMSCKMIISMVSLVEPGIWSSWGLGLFLQVSRWETLTTSHMPWPRCPWNIQVNPCWLGSRWKRHPEGYRRFPALAGGFRRRCRTLGPSERHGVCSCLFNLGGKMFSLNST